MGKIILPTESLIPANADLFKKLVLESCLLFMLPVILSYIIYNADFSTMTTLKPDLNYIPIFVNWDIRQQNRNNKDLYFRPGQPGSR